MTTKSEECPRRLEYVVREFPSGFLSLSSSPTGAWYKIRYEMETGNAEEVCTITKQVSSSFQFLSLISVQDCEKFGEYLVWLENIILQSIGTPLSDEQSTDC